MPGPPGLTSALVRARILSATMRHELSGRDEELQRVERWLEGWPSGPLVTMIQGPSGIGRTALWREAGERARERGWRVLGVSPRASDATLGYLVLHDLFAGPLDADGDQVPDPMREALEVAFMRRPPGVGQRGPDPRACALAIVSLARALARSSPLLIAIDDLQWVDRPSARVLDVALRRLDASPVRLLATTPTSARMTSGAAAGAGPLRGMAREEVGLLSLGPLDIDGLDGLVRDRLGLTLLRPTLRRLLDLSGGVPARALAVASILQPVDPTGETRDPDTRPEALEPLVLHLAELPEATREILVVAACLDRPSLVSLQEATGSRRIEADLRAAVATGIVEVAAGHVRFRDPRASAAIVAAIPVGELAERRRRMAGRLSDDGERVIQTALGNEGPDRLLAVQLLGLSDAAVDAGDPERAARLLGYAVAETPSDDTAPRTWLRLRLGTLLVRLGDTPGAGAVLEAALADAPTPGLRARVLHRLSLVRVWQQGWLAGCATLELALAEAVDEPRLQVAILQDLALNLEQTVAQPAALARAEAAVRVAQELGDDAAIARARAVLCRTGFLLGHESGRDLPSEAPLTWLDDDIGGEPSAWSGSVYFEVALLRKWSDDLSGAVGMLERVAQHAAERRDEAVVAGVRFQRGEIEAWRGDLRAAVALADQANAFGRQHGAIVLRSTYLHALEAVLAGRVDEAHRLADDGIAYSRQVGNHRQLVRYTALQGQLDLARGDVAGAVPWLLEATDLADLAAYGEPAILRYDADTIEALVLAGEVDRAQGLLERLEDRAERLGRPWTVMASARARGIVDAARGREAAAMAAFERCLALHDVLELPYELARSRLAFGAALRRARRIRLAKEELQGALASFESLGMPLWAARARAEAARTGGRGTSRDALTPSELQAAELAASGLTNREIACRASMSVKTVESHLGRAYHKLGVRSRTELARALPPGGSLAAG